MAQVTSILSAFPCSVAVSAASIRSAPCRSRRLRICAAGRRMVPFTRLKRLDAAGFQRSVSTPAAATPSRRPFC